MDPVYNLRELISKGDVRIMPLTLEHEFKPFDCGVDDLNDFLLIDSKKYLRHLRYTTTILELEDKTLAYYSLANDLLRIDNQEDFADEMKNEEHKIHPDYWQTYLEQIMYPAAKIGRLAVHKEFQCNKIGEYIIDFLTYSFTHGNKTGCQFLTLDALNENNQRAIRFYEKKGFKMVTAKDIGQKTRSMYLSLIKYRDE